MSPGTVLVGKYRVERLIGQGGMGVVLEATHVALGERVAMKFLLPDLAMDGEAAERFLREARAAVRIKSPHVAKVSDVGTLESGSPYMVMEFLEGQDASELLASYGVMVVPDAIDLVIQACDAIAEAHSYRIVHRDLKPANLFITRHADGSPFVKVLDFGISKVLDEKAVSSLTRTTTTLGSALYMSPEQIRETRSVDHRTDVYALGVTLYELLSADHPFDADTFPALCVKIATGAPVPLQSRRAELPPELCEVVHRAIAREPGDRFQNVGELCLALQPWAPESAKILIQRIVRLTGASPGAEEISALHAVPTQPTQPTAHASTNSQFAQANTNPHAQVPRSTSPALIAALVAVPALLLLGGGGIWFAVTRTGATAESPVPADSAAAGLTQPEKPPNEPAATNSTSAAQPEKSATPPTATEKPTKPEAPKVTKPMPAPAAQPAPKPATAPIVKPTPKPVPKPATPRPTPKPTPTIDPNER